MGLLDARDAWVAELRAAGFVAAKPWDGYVNRSAQTLTLQYPIMRNKTLEPGDLVMLGSPDKPRCARPVRIVEAKDRGYFRWEDAPEAGQDMPEHMRPSTWRPPVPADDVEKMDLREKLDLTKPVMRELLAIEHDDDPRSSWLWSALRGYRSDSRDYNQCRQEVQDEDRHGHFWAPARIKEEIIEGGWVYEVEYPLGFYLGGRTDGYRPRKRQSDTKRFGWRRAGQRWANRRAAAYKRYVLRLIAEGKYDEYPWGRD